MSAVTTFATRPNRLCGIADQMHAVAAVPVSVAPIPVAAVPVVPVPAAPVVPVAVAPAAVAEHEQASKDDRHDSANQCRMDVQCPHPWWEGSPTDQSYEYRQTENRGQYEPSEPGEKNGDRWVMPKDHRLSYRSRK